MNASCLNVRELIPLFPDDLDTNEVSLVRAHVAGCAACAAELGVFAAQAACFAQVREGRERVSLMAGIQEKLARPASPQVIRFPARALFAAAAAGFLLALGLFALSSQEKKPAEAPVANKGAQPLPEKKSDSLTPVFVDNKTTTPERDGKRPRRHSPRRRIFEQEGATPWSPPGGPTVVNERELTPLDEEAELPQAQPQKRTFAAPPAAHPNTPKASDDESLRF